jgi:hypothetical protein
MENYWDQTSLPTTHGLPLVRPPMAPRSVQGSVVICYCQLKGALAATSATATVDHVVPFGEGRSPLNDPEDMAEELVVKNPRNLAGDGGFSGVDNQDEVIILWDYVAEAGRIFDMPCDTT